MLPAALAEALGHIRPGTRVMSICTGSFVLAAAGLLDGRPATTHWGEADAFQELFPRVELDPSVLFVDDGDLLTSAGAAAGVDLCLHVVRRDHGSEVANQAARRCVVPPWRDGGQAQYIDRPVPEPHDTGTAPVRAWALERLDRPLSLTDLAARAGMSVRTLTRRFREEVGMSPGRWLTVQRVDLARRLLEASDLPVDQIAQRAGFGTTVSLRQHLHAAIGVSPITYRRTFQPQDGERRAGKLAAGAGTVGRGEQQLALRQPYGLGPQVRGDPHRAPVQHDHGGVVLLHRHLGEARVGQLGAASGAARSARGTSRAARGGAACPRSSQSSTDARYVAGSCGSGTSAASQPCAANSRAAALADRARPARARRGR